MSSNPNEPSYTENQDATVPPLPSVPPSLPAQPAMPHHEPSVQYAQQYPVQYGAAATSFPTREDSAKNAASVSMTMGIIGAVLAIIIGWVPVFGIVGVAGGIGLGVPALIHAKRAEENGVKATTGKVMGWIAIAFSVLWVGLYIAFVLTAASDYRHY